MGSKTLALVIVIAVIAGAIWLLESQRAGPTFGQSGKESGSQADIAENTPDTESNYVVDEATKKRIQDKEGRYLKAPELEGIAGYINTPKGTRISDFRGKVVLIDFWTYTCINCIRTLPYLTDWDTKYRDKGLVIIGVHSPEFSFEKEYDNVVAAMTKHGIRYAVVQDNDYATWRAFSNRYWPHKYLIDQDGFIRYDHIGEGAYAQTEYTIQALLEETGVDARMPYTNFEDGTGLRRLTPELYAGYSFALSRGQDVGNGGLDPGKEKTYVLPDEVKNDIIYLGGAWRSDSDSLVAVSEAMIELNFQASSVNIVAQSDQPQQMEVYIDGKLLNSQEIGSDVKIQGGRSYVDISGARLYNVYKSAYGRHILLLKAQPGFSFNSFTFG